MTEHQNNPFAKITAQMLMNDAFSQWMGIKIEAVDKDYCKLVCKIRENMLNGYNVTHGGVIFSIADTALAFAAATSGRTSLVTEHSISFTKSVSKSEEIYAESEIIHQSFKIATGTVKLTDRSGNLISFSKGTVYKKSEDIHKP